MFGSRTQVVKVVLKAVACLAFIGLFTAKSYGQLGVPPIIAVPPAVLYGSSTATNGDTVVLAVTAVSLTTPTFTWYCNGQKISGSKYSLVSSNGILGLVDLLVIKGVDPTNGGAYKVAITNGSGGVVSSAVNLSVVVPSVLTSVISNVVNFVATGTGMTASGFKLQLSCPIGSNVVIHASSNLVNWSPISTNSSSSGTITFTDTNALHVSSRFYRALIQ